MTAEHETSSGRRETSMRHRGRDYSGRLKAAALLPIIILLMVFVPHRFEPDDE